MTQGAWAERLRGVDWGGVEAALWESGCARLPVVLTPQECDALVALYDDETRFRKRIDMERHRFGAGEYQYFARPLPPLVQALRTHAYPPLAAVANRWQGALRHAGRAAPFPADLDRFLRRCARRGQTQPTPLLLRYEAGGFNCLHQDLYGEIAFPLQMTFLLSRPAADFEGGEMLFVEQRPREQSRGTAVALRQGQGVVFATRERPVRGTRGFRRAVMRHGVSRVTSGLRYTLGVIFHDAR
jgi:hypothetical protein